MKRREDEQSARSVLEGEKLSVQGCKVFRKVSGVSRQRTRRSCGKKGWEV